MNAKQQLHKIQEYADVIDACTRVRASTRLELHRYVFEVYTRGDWLELYNSWETCIAATLGDRLSRHERHLLNVEPQILARLQDHPIVKDGIKVDHMTFLWGRISHLQDMIPIVTHLDLRKPEHLTTFEEYMWLAGTRSRQWLREWKKHRSESLLIVTMIEEGVAMWEEPAREGWLRMFLLALVQLLNNLASGGAQLARTLWNHTIFGNPPLE